MSNNGWAVVLLSAMFLLLVIISYQIIANYLEVDNLIVGDDIDQKRKLTKTVSAAYSVLFAAALVLFVYILLWLNNIV
jgi:hypothetical protein